ncbi:PfkB family carbohydrate kinase [Massilia glaciei]|uniref:PfkB family carbohydrate kinase n=1 Tax=Massilia glaciei TaxID=1524097 RepID=UPI001E64F3D2|nr:PfkB family carbohydrate kinase [Massilia glaciei]
MEQATAGGRMLDFGEALVDDFDGEQIPGGAPFNVARTLAAFGQAPLRVPRVGNGAPGARIVAEFERSVLPRDGLQIDRGRPTGRVVFERGTGAPDAERCAGRPY